MPKYDDVKNDRQLPERATAAPARPEKVAEVPITTTVPAPLRRRLTVALAVHEVKLKDAVSEALEAWLEAHPVSLD
ncbi:hypothetical protein [Streptomyces sp. NRRL S-495]|uniref:hypothetical protein n=1 Tax=Streptomyces sp. NRRL S-495 TaxID=1609133 RepID=UPI0005F93F46|nr:hypothetical protein [Streptomyces sp. NRRL S-495]KJY24075.1 hypothetical protein VR45_41500 [Streptomyces sp. NRRL S-495]